MIGAASKMLALAMGGHSRADKWSDLGGVPQNRTARFARWDALKRSPYNTWDALKRSPYNSWDALKRSPYNRRSAGAYNFAKSLGEVDGVQVAGYGNFPFEFFLDGGLKGLGCGGLAVNQVRLFWRGGEAREPAEEFALAGMCGKLP